MLTIQETDRLNELLGAVTNGSNPKAGVPLTVWRIRQILQAIAAEIRHIEGATVPGDWLSPSQRHSSANVDACLAEAVSSLDVADEELADAERSLAELPEEYTR